MTRDGGAGEVMAIVLLAPVVVAFVMLVWFLGRYVDAQAGVRFAAESAAQAAALQRTPGAAHEVALQVANDSLADDSICHGGAAVVPDVSGFGAGGVVTVMVSCTLRRSDLVGLPGLGDQTLTARSSAVVDSYSRRGP